jgi:hypothetical protein
MTSIESLNGGPITDTDIIDQSSPLARALASAANYRQLAHVANVARQRIERDVTAMMGKIARLRLEVHNITERATAAESALAVERARVGALLQLVEDLAPFASAAPARTRAQRGISGHINNIPTEVWTRFYAAHGLALQAKAEHENETR